MKKYNLVVNYPYTDPEEKARRSARVAKLLRPKSDEVSVLKKSRNPAVNDKNFEVDPDSGRLHAECTDECSANIPMVKSIGDENTWAKECIVDLKADNIDVEYLVTDPDSSAYRAAQDLYEEGTNTHPEPLLDTRHVSGNIRKRSKNDKNIL
ncbi:unnamed protein product [Mytilus coruscus]|uniref:Uncharacterized protein n=1 Tax=Mytilus coruscus TaxID=42192 RepID=A0A6J8CIZ0_MYTCO|nr:unnamed protein product [Mytilus coruscus]